MRTFNVELKIIVPIDAHDPEDAFSRAKESLTSDEFDLDQHAELISADPIED